MKNQQAGNAISSGTIAAFVFVGTIVLILAIFTWHAIDTKNFVAAEFDNAEIRKVSSPIQERIGNLKTRASLDAWISKKENDVEKELGSRNISIKKNQRKKIEWAGAALRTPLSIVYLHGFSASRLELDPVISDIAKKLKANLFFTRLKAHGLTSGEEFASVRARDWAVDLEEAIAIGDQIGKRVIVIAMSTAVPLAIENYNRDHSKNIAAFVFLSPNFEPNANGTLLLEGRLGRMLAVSFLGREREFAVANPLHAERWTSKYRAEGLNAMMTAVASARSIDFGTLKKPVLTIYSERDDVVDVNEIRRRSNEFAETGSRIIEWDKATRHELASAAFTPDKVPEFESIISDWISSVTDRAARDRVSGRPKRRP